MRTRLALITSVAFVLVVGGAHARSTAGGTGAVGAFAPISGKALRWPIRLGGRQAIPTVEAIAVVGSKVYVAGDFGLITRPAIR
jgi:hypothetical protein